jgi:hypothetical protein
MQEEYSPQRKKSFDIPPVFYESISGKPFDKCQVCEKSLLSYGVQYIIEKAFRKNPVNNKVEPLFEFSICLDCARGLFERFSDESKEKINQFFMENNRMIGILSNRKEENHVEDYISRCSVLGTPVHELDEYQIYGQFNGNQLMLDMPPYMISAPVMDEVQDLLSAKTMEELDDFTGEYLTGPPEFREFFKAPKRRPVFI